jgi:hypothetical protein
MSISCSLSFFSVYHDSFNAPAAESADRTAAVQLRKIAHQDDARHPWRNGLLDTSY